MSQTKSNQCVVERGVGLPMVTSAPRIPRSNAPAFRTEYVQTARLETLLKASPSNFLGIVLHDRSLGESSGLAACPVVCLDLPQFNRPPLCELWQVLYLQGEMCRSELLLEIEGVLGQEKTIDVSHTVSPTSIRFRPLAVTQHEPDTFNRA